MRLFDRAQFDQPVNAGQKQRAIGSGPQGRIGAGLHQHFDESHDRRQRIAPVATDQRDDVLFIAGRPDVVRQPGHIRWQQAHRVLGQPVQRHHRDIGGQRALDHGGFGQIGGAASLLRKPVNRGQRVAGRRRAGRQHHKGKNRASLRQA